MKCGHCGNVSLMQAGLDRNQCLSCGGYTKADGLASVPTCALEVGASYTGPGANLLTDPSVPPWPAVAWED